MKKNIKPMDGLAPIIGNSLFVDRQIHWTPYHAHQKSVLKDNQFNIFPGFQARKVDKFDMEEYNKIQPLLSHIFSCWANDN